MPFDSAGVYTPAAGATTAAPGDIIRSATWNAIFTDISDALTLLGEQVYGSTSVTSATYVPVANDTFLLVNRAGAVTINLPAAADRGGYPLVIKDVSGAADVNNILLNPDGAETIEGAADLSIVAAYGGYEIYPITGGWILKP